MKRLERGIWQAPQAGDDAQQFFRAAFDELKHGVGVRVQIKLNDGRVVGGDLEDVTAETVTIGTEREGWSPRYEDIVGVLVIPEGPIDTSDEVRHTE